MNPLAVSGPIGTLHPWGSKRHERGGDNRRDPPGRPMPVPRPTTQYGRRLKDPTFYPPRPIPSPGVFGPSVGGRAVCSNPEPSPNAPAHTAIDGQWDWGYVCAVGQLGQDEAVRTPTRAPPFLGGPVHLAGVLATEVHLSVGGGGGGKPNQSGSTLLRKSRGDESIVIRSKRYFGPRVRIPHQKRKPPNDTRSLE